MHFLKVVSSCYILSSNKAGKRETFMFSCNGCKPFWALNLYKSISTNHQGPIFHNNLIRIKVIQIYVDSSITLEQLGCDQTANHVISKMWITLTTLKNWAQVSFSLLSLPFRFVWISHTLISFGMNKVCLSFYLSIYTLPYEVKVFQRIVRAIFCSLFCSV